MQGMVKKVSITLLRANKIPVCNIEQYAYQLNQQSSC